MVGEPSIVAITFFALTLVPPMRTLGEWNLVESMRRLSKL
jgi:hypothetical protein